MLKSLIECRHPAPITIIEDSLSADGADLFFGFLKNSSNTSYHDVQLLCADKTPTFYNEKYGIPKDICIDMWSNPRSWTHSNPRFSVLEVFKQGKLDHSHIKNAVIFIDSLSSLILCTNFTSMYNDLFKLSKVALRLVCLFHGDASNAEDKAKLKYLSTGYLKVTSKNGERLAEILFKKPGGKVVIQKETFTVNDQCQVTSAVEKLERKIKEEKQDMERLTTFKLGLELSENEKAAKSQLVLPYLRNKPVEGKIIYDAEPDDDLEEDPDEDLYI